MEIRNGLNALVVILNIIFFIRAVQVVIIQAKTHEDDLDAQLSFQDGTNGDTATATNGNGRFAKRGFHCFGCSLVSLAVNWRHIWLAAVVLKCFYGYR